MQDFLKILVEGPWFMKWAIIIVVVVIVNAIYAWLIQRNMPVKEGTHSKQFLFNPIKIKAQASWVIGLGSMLIYFYLVISEFLLPVFLEVFNSSAVREEYAILMLLLMAFLFTAVAIWMVCDIFNKAWTLLNIKEKSYLEVQDNELRLQSGRATLGKIPLTAIDEMKVKLMRDKNGRVSAKLLFIFLKKNTQAKITWPNPWSFGKVRALFGLKPRYLVPDIFYFDTEEVIYRMKEA